MLSLPEQLLHHPILFSMCSVFCSRRHDTAGWTRERLAELNLGNGPSADLPSETGVSTPTFSQLSRPLSQTGDRADTEAGGVPRWNQRRRLYRKGPRSTFSAPRLPTGEPDRAPGQIARVRERPLDEIPTPDERLALFLCAGKEGQDRLE
jgi:hypothetical protein